jgi:hypothetical protein
MGRVYQVVVLALLLIYSGAPGFASELCSPSSPAHAHACCAAHEQDPGKCATGVVISGESSCCKVAPAEPAPSMPLFLNDNSLDGAYVLQATSALAAILTAPQLVAGRSSPRLAKLVHSPVHAVLCTFLV